VRSSALVAFFALVVGCADAGADETCSVPTDELAVVAAVVDNGVTLRAEVELSTEGVDGPRPLSLCTVKGKQDTLQIEGGEPEVVERPDGSIYASTLDQTTVRTVIVDLARKEHASLVLTIELPPSFEVVAPVVGAEISRSAELLLEWMPANPGAQMRIELAEEIGNGVCLETLVAEHDYKGLAGVDIEDDGNWKIPAEAIDGGARDHCDASYRFTRVLGTPYPEALGDGGYLEGRVERVVPFVSVP
jgi:hypothetical protein